MTRVALFAALFLAAGLSGACLTPSPLSPPVGLPLLIYETQDAYMCSPCTGVRIILSEDTRMWVEERRPGLRGSPWGKRRLVELSWNQVDAVWDLLEPYRPPRDGPPFGLACEERIPDQGGVNITWRSAGSAKWTIAYSGCDPEANRELRSRLNRVPAMLGLTGGPYV